jgi:hypothetical protein
MMHLHISLTCRIKRRQLRRENSYKKNWIEIMPNSLEGIRGGDATEQILELEYHNLFLLFPSPLEGRTLLERRA